MKTKLFLRTKLPVLFLALVIAFTMLITPTTVAKAATADQMLLVSQKWLNNTYSGNTGYVSVPEDGTSRSATVDSMITALQIELGITSTATSFGTGTTTKFNTAFPNGISQQADNSTTESNIYGIIQCALWTKGYSVGSSTITKHFFDGTGSAVRSLKADMGFQSPNSTVTLNIMKALLSMKQYQKIAGGTDQIRSIQQELNRSYESYLGLIPCDGFYGRDMNKALIIVLQTIEGYSVANATGNFGSGTKANLPINIDVYSSWTSKLDTYQKCIKLIEYCLVVNGYGNSVDISNNSWNSQLSDAIKTFQKTMVLNETGKMNVDTWMAFLLSTGNPDRPCLACDTRFEMTNERLDYLKSNGYTTIGRYLTGGDFKQLRTDEPQRIIDKGLSFFPIFQESGTDLSYFTTLRAEQDAVNAENAALSYKIPENSIIYFAVDTDPTDPQIANYILPYFQTLSQSMTKYKIGVYGTRNTCQQVISAGYATSAFVSDLSTGFSGNMGFTLPDNWYFDQFGSITVTTASGSWDLDKVVCRSQITATDCLSPNFTPFNFDGTNTGEGFYIPSSKVKAIKYNVSFETTEPMILLDVSLNRDDYDTNTQNHTILTLNTMHLKSYVSKTLSSEWIDVSGNTAQGYFFHYECLDESKPIIGPIVDGQETNYGLEHGSCKNVTVSIDYKY
jgi:peptidoglycan hydrolase-like protein with peptidoglycan-binding domain